MHMGLVTDEGAEAIASSPHLTGLQELDLAEAEIGTAGALALARATRWGGLKLLNLRWNTFDAAARRALRQTFGRRVGM